MKYLLRITIIVAILIAVSLAFIYSGIYNVSAMVPHNKLTLWMMNTVSDYSVKHNANDTIKMPDLSDDSLVKMGFVHYREMCVSCHGAPGIKQSEFAEGLYPNPPMLSKVAEDWTPQQLFWITKNGLKMTGMPAFGPTHNDNMIWAIVAFTKTLPAMTNEQYQVLDNETKGESDESDEHTH